MAIRIGIELHQIIPGVCGGIVPLLQGVLTTLFNNHPECRFFLFCTKANAGLFPALPGCVQRVVFDHEDYFYHLDQWAAKRRLDVLFRSYPWDSLLGFPAERQVWLIPDMQHEYFPEFFAPHILKKRRECFDKVLGEAAAVATLSEYAEATIRAQPATRCADVFLMHPALMQTHIDPTSMSDEERRLLPEGEFFYFPGNLWPHKNHRRTLQAFERFLKRSGRSCELILTGHPEGWEALAAEFPGLPARHLGFVSRPVVHELMGRALALVFFSLFEGFGIPLLEAFDAGTPVVCSNTTSLPEVGGDAVLTCDPSDVQAMSTLLQRVAEDADLRAGMAARGKERLSVYTWQQSADNLLAACRRVAARHPTTSWKPLALRAAQPLLHSQELFWPGLRRSVKGLLPRKVARVVRALIHPRDVLWPALQRRVKHRI